MNIQNLPAAAGDRVIGQLVDGAAAVLRGRGAGVPDGFAAHLFAGASAEDLAVYSTEEIARFIEQAYAFLAERRPGAPKIRIYAPEGEEGSGRNGPISVLEIVNDDMPFLVDSVLGELTARHAQVRLVVHPIFSVMRDDEGRLEAVSADDSRDGDMRRESFIHVHIDRVEDVATTNTLILGIEQALSDVAVAVQDWRSMLARVGELIADMKARPSPVPESVLNESIEFLEWLAADNFTFLGIREYRVSGGGEPVAIPESGLGVLRRADAQELKGRAGQEPIARGLQAFYNEKTALMITKASLRSRVHRRVFMDMVIVKRFDAHGAVTGEFRIVGLFTSTAYTRSTRSIPFLRKKVEALLKRARFSPAGHSGKALVNALETYPRDDLFRIDDELLFQFAMLILQLDERPRVRVLARRDRFDRFMSVLVYLPRARSSNDVVEAVGEMLAQRYKGHVSGLSLFFPEGPMMRAHYIIARSAQQLEEPDRATLESGVSAIVRTWADALSEQLEKTHEPVRARQLFERYRRAFSASFRDRYSPDVALDNIRTIEALSAERPLSVDFHARPGQGDDRVGLKVWSYGGAIPLSSRVPMLENMGFRVVDERTYEIRPATADGAHVWMHDMSLESADGAPVDIAALEHALEACFLMVMRGIAENDGYNALVLKAGLQWRDIVLIRAISRFLRQVRLPFSQDYMWATLRAHCKIAAQIVALFHARFDPRHDDVKARAEREADISAAIEAALENVPSLDEDRILRHFVNAVQSALRTNFYQIGADGQPKAQIAIKYESGKLTTLPAPRPLYEIFVYSPRVEGVHLRFGKVARGGIRWSDRPQDFRTEILGLVKAQQVKNAVIVPVGAKGGFVPKHLPVGGTREAIAAEGIAAYKLFIGSLLDVTDNLSADGAVVPPENVVRHDADDPYLVVAADKGTATFSDTANEISTSRKFWLGDAFASGGSAGYDHKKMGITARGAWEAVKRHFREMDVDIGTTPFTVIGVGDMSGDVFGNGMLRETTIKLVAAFDHRDIFIDPDPDPAKSFAERKRLFELPRSSWQDYDKALISKGGGVFPRSLKEIQLSPEMKSLLNLTADKATPQQLMSAILKCEADLLFFGGIGTYVRAATETDEQVGDRANDAIRICGADLNCKVIGEGANLGMTQRGRIEAAQKGVRLNTDAIDNSAGVNTSDLEVNIKIALGGPVRSGALKLDDRNALLFEMTDEVAALVLRNNYLQTLAISLAERNGLEDLASRQRLMQTLEGRGLLDRGVEFLPDDAELAERRRRGQALTRPELAVLLAYAKLTLFADLVETSVPDDPYLGKELTRYFPAELSRLYPDELEHHRLRREIIATHLTNSIINRGGPSLIARMTDETGASADRIARAFAAVRDSYGMVELNAQIDALDNKVAGALQLDLYAAVKRLLIDRMVWFIRNVDLDQGLMAVVEHYGTGIEQVAQALDAALTDEAAVARNARAAELMKSGVPEKLAMRIASLPALTVAPDIVLVADKTGREVPDVARTFLAVVRYFRLERIANDAREISAADYFDRLALDRARDHLAGAARRLTADVLKGGAGFEAMDAWVKPRHAEVERIRTAMHEIADTGLTISKLSVAASLLGDLAGR
ncbi:NAD-glutamate dehydrogenase [Pseudorhodoplanes sp.]|uniref:NAD-glutamate dehydrogenase n=1 Tax=Pseudorhodoplanes sp. TaxID=1934341 RepID=UPI00391C1442